MLFGLLTSVSVCLGMLFFSVPLNCWSMVCRNCRRLDGSFSHRRLRREVRAFCTYSTTLSVPVLLMFLTCFLLATLLFRYIVPCDLIVRTFAEFHVDGDIWRHNLADVRADHARFLRTLGAGPETVLGIQKSLWHNWPVIALTGLVVGLGTLAMLVKFAGRAAADLTAGIRVRRQMYARTDVKRMRCAGAETARLKSGSAAC